MFVLLVVGLIFNFIFPPLSLACVITTMVLASILSCGCCCAKDYELRSNVKRFAIATLVSLCLMFAVQVVGLIAITVSVSTEVSNTGTISPSSLNGATTGVIILSVIGLVLNIMALVFSALFTWGRGCLAS